jgi:hypothetical protein
MKIGLVAKQVAAAVQTVRTSSVPAKTAQGLMGRIAGELARRTPQYGAPFDGAARTTLRYAAPADQAPGGPASTGLARASHWAGRFQAISQGLAGLGGGEAPGAHGADEARLTQKREEMQGGIADSAIDEAKSKVEEAKEQFKLEMRILSEHMERMTQVTQKITS